MAGPKVSIIKRLHCILLWYANLAWVYSLALSSGSIYLILHVKIGSGVAWEQGYIYNTWTISRRFGYLDPIHYPLGVLAGLYKDIFRNGNKEWKVVGLRRA